jgi:hypothetical protein
MREKPGEGCVFVHVCVRVCVCDCVCMCVCVYVCVCVCTYIYIQTYAYAYIHTYGRREMEHSRTEVFPGSIKALFFLTTESVIYIHVCVCVCVCVYTAIRASVFLTTAAQITLEFHFRASKEPQQRLRYSYSILRIKALRVKAL